MNDNIVKLNEVELGLVTGGSGGTELDSITITATLTLSAF